MTKKAIALKVWSSIGRVFFLFIVVISLLRMADTFSIFCISIIGLCLAFTIILMNVIIKIDKRVDAYKKYKTLENGLQYLKKLDKTRYQLFYTGNKEMAKEYSAKIARYSNAMLNTGRIIITKKSLSKKHINEVKRILDQTKELMTTTTK